MLFDADGRAIVRRKEYGLTRGPRDYVLAEPPSGELVDAIGNTFLPEEEEEIDDDCSPTREISAALD